MSWRSKRVVAVCALLTGLLIGCRDTQKTLHYLGDADLDYYKESAQQIDFPDVASSDTVGDVSASLPPRTVLDRRKDEIWNLPLLEALHTAMANNRIIRSNAQFLSTGNSLYGNSDRTPSVFDAAIQESNVLFGGRGVEAALAEFDAQFSSSIVLGRNKSIQNNAFIFGSLPGRTLSQETGQFRAALQKQFAYGGSLLIGHDWDYLWQNTAAQLFPSVYTGNLRAEYRQPLWAASGAEFTRIAGVTNPNFGSITGVSQGVVIARINNDITLADFQANIRNLLKDVEDLYWDLYLSYRLYDTAVVARNSAMRSWREAKEKFDAGGAPNFKNADEAQARDRLFETRAAAETALNEIYITEERLRRLIGLTVNDGRIIRPADEPSPAKFVPDWYACLAEALTRRVELRRQKWQIKSLSLQLRAAKSLTRPRLDLVATARSNAFGDKLISRTDNDGVTSQGVHNAYETLTQGDQTGGTFGFQFSMPIGFRSARAQVRNIELRLAKARELLSVQELEISHELAQAVQQLAANYATAQSNFYRQAAAKRRLTLFEAELDAGTATLDLILRAQASLADAERAYYTSLVKYNKAITGVYFRKGMLLEHDSVHLAESDWTPEAYDQALRRARARSHAIDNRMLHTEPEEFVLPGYSSEIEMPLPIETSPDGDQPKSDAVPPVPAASQSNWRPAVSTISSPEQSRLIGPVR